MFLKNKMENLKDSVASMHITSLEQDNTQEYNEFIDSDYLEDWKKTLVWKKPEATGKPVFNPDLGPTFELISKICMRLKISPEIEFSSYDTYLVMLENFTYALKDSIEENSDNDQCVEDYWLESYKNFRDDCFLTIILVISITMKMYQQKNNITALQIQALAKRLGKKLELSCIIERELQLLKNMGTKVQEPKALYTMGAIAQTLKHTIKSQIVTVIDENFFKLGTTLMRLFYLDSSAIYGRVFEREKNFANMQRFIEDKPLVGAAVVYLVFKIYNLKSSSLLKNLLTAISNDVKRSKHDIVRLSRAIHLSFTNH